LSATAGDIGNTLYLNIRKYIDFVSNVDLCKIRSLKSMLYMFGFKNTLIDGFFMLPTEILNLMDVLSINKKYLIKAGVLKKEFLNDLISSDVIRPVFESD